MALWMFRTSDWPPMPIGKLIAMGVPLTNVPPLWNAIGKVICALVMGFVPVGHPPVGVQPLMYSGATGQTVLGSHEGAPGYAAPDSSTPVSPKADVVLPAESSKPTTYVICVQAPAWSDWLVCWLTVLSSVVMMGMMFAPHELSMPPLPSTCTCFDEPASRVHTSVEDAVVILPSRS